MEVVSRKENEIVSTIDIIVITVAWTEMKRIFIPVTILVALRNRGIIMEQLPSGVQFSTKDPV